MQTKHLAYILGIFTILGASIVLLFNYNEDFRVLIQGIKYAENKSNIEVTDNLELPENNIGLEVNPNNSDNLENNNQDENNLDENNLDGIDLSSLDLDNTENINLENTEENNNINTENPENNIAETEEILSQEEKNILDKFSEYLLTHNDIFLPLFGVLRDYPNKYETYSDSGGEINLYFFGKQDYNGLKAYFESKKSIINMEVNEVNNFADNSFYLNSPENNTGRTRIIFKKGEYIYALDINKTYYNNIKTILLSL